MERQYWSVCSVLNDKMKITSSECAIMNSAKFGQQFAVFFNYLLKFVDCYTIAIHDNRHLTMWKIS